MRCCFLAFLSALVLAFPARSDTENGTFTGTYLGGQAAFLSGDRSSGAVGFHLGFGVTLGAPLILGIELELDGASRPIADSAQRIESLTRFKVRAGGRSGDTHLYGLGGLTVLDSSLGNAQGGMIGAGGEIDLGEGRSVGIELTHEHFDEIGTSGQGLELTGLSFRAGLRF